MTAGCDVSTVANAACEQGLVVRLIDLDQNGGLPSAPNVGIQAARGDYLGFLDDDDIFLPSHLGTTLAALSTGDADLAYMVCVVQEACVDPTNLHTAIQAAAATVGVGIRLVSERRPATSRRGPGCRTPALRAVER